MYGLKSRGCRASRVWRLLSKLSGQALLFCLWALPSLLGEIKKNLPKSGLRVGFRFGLPLKGLQARGLLLRHMDER